MSNDVVLAFDTSNYTTSVAIMSIDGELIANRKQLLPVKEGERGLRQSDALFSHTVNLPVIMSELSPLLSDKRVVCIGVSDKPRAVEGSYMPCFLAGVSAAQSTAAALGVPLYRFSHQDGHMMAALFSSDAEHLIGTSFAALHVSGGTTELLRVTPSEEHFAVECVGGTADLNAGQIIDRVGVYMGMPFPSGPHVEREALLNTAPVPKRKISRNGLSVNLSGLENIAKGVFDKTSDKALTSMLVLDYIGRAISDMCNAYTEKYGDEPFVFAGGVMSNSIIKKMLADGREARFAEPVLSSDNAVGTARLALKRYLSER